MLLLIDGYNLLQSTDIFPQGRSAGTLAAARQALLDFLARSLEERLRNRTTIVFDAAMAPPGLPREGSHAGMTIRFAPRKVTADEVLEELIAAAADPRHLLVVSSDHRIQRAARQRGAQWIDSQAWYAALVRSPSVGGTAAASAAKPEPVGDNPFPPGYAADVAAEDWRPPSPDPPRRGKGRKS